MSVPTSLVSPPKRGRPRLAALAPAIVAEAGGPRARVIGHIKATMESGALKSGELLPATATLSQLLGVNWRTVNSALEMLRDEGAIRSNGGRLWIVNGSSPSDARATSSLLEHSVAVLTGHTETPQHREGGWLEYLTAGALNAIREAGWHGLSLHPARLQGAEASRVLADPPAGVVVTDLPLEEMRDVLFGLRAAGTSVVLSGDWPEFPDFDRVSSDHDAGAYEVTRFLIQKGRRRILQTAVAPGTSYWYAGRRAGYERAMREAELEILPLLMLPPFPPGGADVFQDGVRHLAGYLIEHLAVDAPIDALMAPTDADTFGLAAACRVFGKIPNRDVLIAGYDNYWAECSTRALESTSPVVTVDKNNAGIGAAMVALVLDRIEGRLPAEPQRRIVAPRLVEIF